ncbi:hypothetical protein AB0E12_23725 [Micromonospora chersina]|uniref:hypothetical protein n=1 Tax=Micromonospora chersina TaxID=47854 RepID=UPI0033DE7A48
MDPVTVAVVAAGAHAIIRMVSVHVEARMLRARSELAQAVANLPPGTEISGISRDGGTWTIRVPVVVQLSAVADGATGGGQDD